MYVFTIKLFESDKTTKLFELFIISKHLALNENVLCNNVGILCHYYNNIIWKNKKM